MPWFLAASAFYLSTHFLQGLSHVIFTNRTICFPFHKVDWNTAV